MYIQLTTNCGMECAHCAFSCGPEKKRFMSDEVFEAAINLAASYEDYTTLGGGEPTNHPKFLDFLGKAIVTNTNEDAKVYVITNGDNTEIALKLAKLQSQGIIGCELSVDDFHYSIEEKVYKAFGYTGSGRHRKEHVRSVNRIIKQGRAKYNDFSGWDGIKEDFEGCVCADVFVAPTGKVYSCGCFRQNIGHILDENFYKVFSDFCEKYILNECYKSNERKIYEEEY